LTEKLYKQREQVGVDKEEEVSSYSINLMKTEANRNLKASALWRPASEEAMDHS
jgi:hypothetical protein